MVKFLERKKLSETSSCRSKHSESAIGWFVWNEHFHSNWKVSTKQHLSSRNWLHFYCSAFQRDKKCCNSTKKYCQSGVLSKPFKGPIFTTSHLGNCIFASFLVFTAIHRKYFAWFLLTSLSCCCFCWLHSIGHIFLWLTKLSKNTLQHKVTASFLRTFENRKNVAHSSTTTLFKICGWNMWNFSQFYGDASRLLLVSYSEQP